ncbi:MAG: NUDIX hydrolase [Chitinophagaceae bacterium]|nr:NUDIX hydrolase [Chitinophagaceae bacterium]
MKWKILSSEHLVQRPFFSARKDICETETGKIIPEYFTVELGLTTCALGITENNMVVMIRQYRHPVGKVLLEIPGGFANEDESAEKAIAREMLEETGYTFSKYEYLGEVAANPGVLNNYTKLYLATGGKKTTIQNLDANEEIKVELISLDDLTGMLLQNKIEQSLHANCIFYGLLKMGKIKITAN